MKTRLAFVIGATLALAACADRAEVTTDTPLPEVATIVCDASGTTVETPSVRPQPDGLHLVIDNRTDVDPGFSVEFDHGGLGDNAPPGTSEHVLDVPPGTVRIGCYPNDRAIGDPDLRELEVVDVEGIYRSTALDCTASSVGVSDYAPGAEGERGDPVDLARAILESATGGLGAQDVVERAGYPDWDEPVVRLVRAGEVMATVEFRTADGGGWLQDTVSMCGGLSSG